VLVSPRIFEVAPPDQPLPPDTTIPINKYTSKTLNLHTTCILSFTLEQDKNAQDKLAALEAKTGK